MQRRFAGQRRSQLAGVAIVLLAIVGMLLGVTVWAVITNPGAPDGTLTGWGSIGGVEGVSGDNINDVISDLGGTGSYRPALLSTVLLGAALLGGIVLLVRRASRVGAAGAVVFGTLAAAWALYRAFVPGNVAGIVEEGGTRSATAPWIIAGCAVLVVVAGVVALLDRPPSVRQPPRTRGIQPR